MPRPRQTKLDGRRAVTESTRWPSGTRQASSRVGVSPLVERRGAKSFANDLVEDRGVVIVRAVFRCDSLRVSLWSTICPWCLKKRKGHWSDVAARQRCSKTLNFFFKSNEKKSTSPKERRRRWKATLLLFFNFFFGLCLERRELWSCVALIL